MRPAIAALAVVAALTCAVGAQAAPADASPTRPVATYSIVARDAATGDLGVAVQSHWFSVGSIVTWAEPGVGAVATQSFVEPAYGPRGLARMRAGEAPGAALEALLAADEQSSVRQVAFVDASGRVAAHTGSDCIPGAGHVLGDGFSVQANLMLTDDVPQAMAREFARADGPLAERMLAALRAAQLAGGDVRGRQSAAILVVRGTAGEAPWADRLVDLRVDDHDRPLDELARLLRLHRAYERMNRGDEAMAQGSMDRALAEYEAAQRMEPENDEFVFWTAVTLVGNDRLDDALPLFERAFRMNPSWALVVPRLRRVGQLPDDDEVVRRILAIHDALLP